MATRASKISLIQPLEPGSGRTLLSARTANELIHAINALLKLSGRDGLEVHRAESGYVISLSPEIKSDIESTGEPGGGSGTLNWRGGWHAEESYEVGDVVIRHHPNDQVGQESHTFVCLQAYDPDELGDGVTLDDVEPPAGEVPITDYWQVLARGAWARLVVADPANADIGSADFLGGQVIFDLGDDSRPDGWEEAGDPDATHPTTKIDFGRIAELPEDMRGLTLSPMLLRGCDIDTGEAVTIAIIGAVVPEP